MLQATIASANEDENPDDNVISKVIVYTDDEYGHDDEGALNWNSERKNPISPASSIQLAMATTSTCTTKDRWPTG